MTRNLLLFLAMFVAGAAIALVVRAARFEPHARHETATGHVSHSSPQPTTANPATGAVAPVNTLCAICGMAVDPTLPTAEYQGKTIGFGCRMCPPKFKAEPDRYGPLYLRNEVIKR
jgi:YHS domain-containing protein